jgi:hypothetical protein
MASGNGIYSSVEEDFRAKIVQQRNNIIQNGNCNSF